MKRRSILNKQPIGTITLIFWPALILINLTLFILLFAFHEAWDLHRLFTVDPTCHLQLNNSDSESAHDDRV